MNAALARYSVFASAEIDGLARALAATPAVGYIDLHVKEDVFRRWHGGRHEAQDLSEETTAELAASLLNDIAAFLGDDPLSLAA